MKAWVDGKLTDAASATVPVLDHGLLYGDGVFEGMRAYDGKVFRLDAHLARLNAGSRALLLELPDAEATLRTAIRECLVAFGESEAYLRLIVSRGSGPLGVDPLTCPQPRVICIAAKLSLYAPEKLAQGLALASSSYRRPEADVLDSRIKSLNYLNSALAKLEARQKGADEALLLNRQGKIAEAAVANLFLVRDGILLTPPCTDGALEGITRRTVFELAQARELDARECSLTRFDLYAATEAFLTGSGAGLIPVSSLDGRAVGNGRPGPIWESLLADYRASVPRYCRDV